MKKAIRILSFLFIISFSSCEKIYWTNLKNSTNQNLILKITLDKDSITKYNSNLSESKVISFNNGGKLLKVDSLNYVVSFLLKPTEEYTFEGGLGVCPKFTEISKITIYGKDTLNINSRKELFKYFKEEETRKYILEIK